MLTATHISYSLIISNLNFVHVFNEISVLISVIIRAFSGKSFFAYSHHLKYWMLS